MTVKLAGLVEYDGTEFSGWARQPGRRTIEETLAEALGTVLRHQVSLAVAGRTDAGVHASGQVISFTAEPGWRPEAVAYKATAVLPEDVALRRCVAAPEDFDARRSATSRRYEYRIVNDPARSPLERRRATYVPLPLDVGAMEAAAVEAAGRRDFRAFTPARSHHTRFERTITESEWGRDGDLLVYRVTADSFLYGMVRAMVGTMIEVGLGKRSIGSFERLFSGAERGAAGYAAPARGLVLTDVGYEDLDFGEGGYSGR